MTPLMLRQLWSIVEATQTAFLLSLDDNALVQWLMRQLRATRVIDGAETDLLNDYIRTRLPLIREIVQDR